MAPQFNVNVARRCQPRVKALRGEAKNSFERVVEELRHRGCEAGGTRMRAETGGDHHICERRRIGRARDRQPQCCDSFDDPPADPDLVRLVNQIRPARRRPLRPPMS